MPRNDLLHLVPSGCDTPSAFLAADRYWDAVVRDGPLPDATIDPTLAATIHHLQELDDAPLPDAAFAARLERELLRGASPSGSVPLEARADLKASGLERSETVVPLPVITRRLHAACGRRGAAGDGRHLDAHCAVGRDSPGA